MKPTKMTLLLALLITTTACRPQQADNRTQMLLDSKPEGKYVTIVRPKETVRPMESVADIKELPTIMQHDIDAAQRLQSKEVTYVKPGETLRPSEARR
jgi:hypothetical protein